MQVKKQQLEADMEQCTGSKLGKGYVKAVYSYLTYLICMQSTSCEMPGWMKHQLESRLLGEISITSLRYAHDSTLMAESKEELKSLLMKVKEESEKAGLKLNTEKWRPWHLVPPLHGKLMGKQWKQWQTLFSWASESLQMVTAAMIKRRLLLGRRAMANLDSVLKRRDITLATKVCLVKAMVFPVVMYGCESWTIKKAERRRIDAFKLWCWGRLLRAPWAARTSNQSVLKKTSSEYSLEGLMLKLKLQYFGHMMWRTNSLERMSFQHLSWCWKDWRQEEEGDDRG